MKEHEEGFSMPVSAQAYAGPPYWGRRKGPLSLVFFRVDPKELAWEIPEPLELHPDNIGLCWLGDLCQPPHTYDQYHETCICIKAKYKEYIGYCIVYIWTSNDQATLFAREVYGWPSQLCDDERLRYNGSQILGECNRNEVRLVRIVLNADGVIPPAREKPLEAELAKFFEPETAFLQVRKIPSPEKGGKPLKDVIYIPLEDFVVHEVWKGPATLEFGKSGYHPHLHKLNPTEVIAGFISNSEWIVPYGKVLWKNY